MTLPLVSIVTPSFNQGQYIEDTIKSVLGQNYENLEYIIIDGGSTDNTLEIIKKYSSKLAYWVSEKDDGQSGAINKGFAVANGKYINWLNSDDVLLDSAVQKMTEYLEAHPHIDLVYGNVVMMREDGSAIAERREFKYDNNIILYGINYLPQPSALYRKTAVTLAGSLDETMHFCMDHEYWLRFYSRGLRFAYLNECFAGYRVHNRSKGFSDHVKEITKERLLLKRKYGKPFKARVTEIIFHKIFFLYYRCKRKLIQIFLHGGTNIIPFSVRARFFLERSAGSLP